ncbi:hypothetical protein LRD69_04455 [Streptomyces sp. JH14]|uniref:hypothetical protein n=1 Tax=Streptomyces sp. JH14 TaxID=2793630 RepID=UPI0023F91AC2|nr:hypothetical protein [Streptomyces sp. JH14]MDF6041423.1 hypothetical protein [Streptomyces sp. JH14]
MEEAVRAEPWSRPRGSEPSRSGKAYRLRCDDRGTVRFAGLMNRAETSRTALPDGPADGASDTGVTVDPAGGFAQPASAPPALPTSRPYEGPLS